MKHLSILRQAGPARNPGWGWLYLLAATGWAGPLMAEGMPDQLQTLASRHGFKVQGFELLAPAPARRVSGSPRMQIRKLLENYNYILVGTPNDGVEKVIIMGAKGQNAPPPGNESTKATPTSGTDPEQADGEIIVPTRQENGHHLVDGELTGSSGDGVTVTMTVDTGASFIVLPQSMAAELGFDVEELGKRQVSTANGLAEAAVGTLAAVAVGEAKVDGAEVAFIDDEKLGDHALLGMSVLGRFQFELDSEQSRLILRPK